MPKDEGLIASEADFLNTELRMNYGDHFQVDMDDDWRPAIRGLVDGVRLGEEFNRGHLIAAAPELLKDAEAFLKVSDHLALPLEAIQLKAALLKTIAKAKEDA